MLESRIGLPVTSDKHQSADTDRRLATLLDIPALLQLHYIYGRSQDSDDEV